MIDISDIHSAKLLIVDDQQVNVSLLDRRLRTAGYTSIASTLDPRDVCELHRKNGYDLILLDLEMPGMDGFEVMEGLKQIEGDNYLPVLVITAEPEHKVRALKAGARDFVSKPIDLPELLTRVHNMLEVRLLHRETRRLYDQVLSEQQVSERLLRTVLPRSVAERFKADRSISDLLRLSIVETVKEPMDAADTHRRAAARTADALVVLVIATGAVAGAAWWRFNTLPIWGRALGTVACAASVVAAVYAWNRRFVAGELHGQAAERQAAERQAAERQAAQRRTHDAADGRLGATPPVREPTIGA